MQAGPEAGEVERLVLAEGAARSAGESVARWWRQLASSPGPSSPLPLDELFRSSLTSIRSVLGADTISLLVADEDGAELVARASVGLDEEVHRDLRIRAGQGMAGRVLASRQALIVDDLATIELASPVLREQGLVSVVAVPVLAGERILGVLHAGSYEQGRFGQRDADMLALVAGRLASAMERVWLLEIERFARHRAEELANHLGRLQAVTSALAGATDIEGVAQAVSTALAERDGATDGDAGTQGPADPDSVGGASGVAPPLPPRRARLLLSPSLGAKPMDGTGQMGDAGIPDDASPAPLGAGLAAAMPVMLDGPEGVQALPGHSSSGAYAAIPVLLRGDVVGAIEVTYDGPHHFSVEEAELLSVLAEQVALALDRALLLGQQAQVARTASFLAQAARELSQAESYQGALDQLAELGLQVLGDICLIDVLNDDGSLGRMVARHRDRSRQALVDRLHDEFPPDPTGPHPALEVIRSGQSHWSPVMDDDFMRTTTRNEAHLALTRALGFRSYLSVPLRSASAVLGALTLISTGPAFGPKDVTLAEALAQQVAAVVDGARRYESAYRTAKILQDHLLPRSSPLLAGAEIYAQYLAATGGADIGGDFYDALEVAPGRIGFVIGDVEGHDREAAAIMGQLRSAVRALFDTNATLPGLLSALSAGWARMGFSRTATVLLGTLEPSNGRTVLASAGHYPPLLVRDGPARYLPVPPNLPLGVGPLATVELWSGALDPGDVLLLYTDGALQERALGIDDAMASLAALAGPGPCGPRQVCQRVVADLPPSRPDDVALLALAQARTPG